MPSRPQGYFDLPRILSRPLKLHWLGWETDTYSLQQAGWKLSAEQDYACDRMRLMMEHEGTRMQAMTDVFDFGYGRATFDWEGIYVNSLRIPVQCMARSITIHAHGKLDWNMRPIDAQPMMTHQAIHSMEDLAHFTTAHTRTQEVLLDEADVPTMLQAILQKQDPARQERLKQMVKDERSGLMVPMKHTFHAQLVSIAA